MITPELEPQFPMRINKYLAWKGYATRRGADALIEKKKVTINGRLAVLGDKVIATDEVLVKDAKRAHTYRYLAYYKPQGVVTHSPQYGDADIVSSIDVPGVFPIGRLDKDSHGLIILTDDGRITKRLLDPTSHHEKEYSVTTIQKLRGSFKDKMEQGVHIDTYTTQPCTVTILGDTSFSIVLTEGKRHQIRRMCAALHTDVRDLKRVRIMNIHLGSLQPNEYRLIMGSELETFLSSLGL